jgi:hypothetical protein
MLNCVMDVVAQNENTVVLLATDHQSVVDSILNKTGRTDKIIQTKGAIGRILCQVLVPCMVTYRDVVQSGATFHRSALELILLSEVDHLFITAASTFGGTATLLGYMLPRYVTVDKPYVFEVLLLSNTPIRLRCEEASIAKGPDGKKTNTVLW